MLWIIDDRRVGADQHQVVRGRRSRHLREVAIAHRVVLGITEVIWDVVARILYMKARVAGSVHPSQVIVMGIDRRRIWRRAELLAIRPRQRPKIVIEGVIFFDDDHDVFDRHSNLRVRRGPTSGPVLVTASQRKPLPYLSPLSRER